MNEKSCLNAVVFVFAVQSWLLDPNIVVKPKTLESDIFTRPIILVEPIYLSNPSHDYGN
jgi:hypothetical protein